MTEYYSDKFEEGLAYQDFVIDELYKIGFPLVTYASRKYQYTKGESKCVEIKLDNNWRRTGNLYFETAEKTKAENENFIVSGILRDEQTWLYIIGDYTKIFILSKKQLALLHDIGHYRKVEIATSQGILIPVTEIETKYAIKIIETAH